MNLIYEKDCGDVVLFSAIISRRELSAIGDNFNIVCNTKGYVLIDGIFPSSSYQECRNRWKRILEPIGFPLTKSSRDVRTAR